MNSKVLNCFLILLLTATLNGCRQTGESDKKLQSIGTLMREFPDSAYALLRQFPHETLSGETKAHYALLLSALTPDRTSILTADSLIDIALNFYSESPDSAMRAKTYFYRGMIFLKMKQAAPAIKYLLMSADYANAESDFKFRARIHHTLSKTYFDQTLYGQALQTALQAETLALQAGKTDKEIPVIQRSVAGAYMGLNNYPKAIEYEKKALHNAQNVNRDLIPTIINEIAASYKTLGQYDKALHYLSLNNHLTSYEQVYHHAIKGAVYNRMKQYDSAIYYINKSMEHGNIFTKASGYSDLSDIYATRKDYKKAVENAKLYNDYRDSIEQDIQSTTVMEMQSIYRHTQLKDENHRLKLREKTQTALLYQICAACLFILLAGAYTHFRLRIKKERQSRLQEQEIQRQKNVAQKAQNEFQQSELVRIEKEKEILELKHKATLAHEKESLLREYLFRKLNSLEKIPSLHPGKSNKADVIQKESRIRLSDSDWRTLQQNIDEAYDGFTLRLSKSYPSLSSEDIRFCCLVKINVKLNDLSEIFHVSKDAVTKRKFRIKTEKMKLGKSKECLDDILSSF